MVSSIGLTPSRQLAQRGADAVRNRIGCAATDEGDRVLRQLVDEAPSDEKAFAAAVLRVASLRLSFETLAAVQGAGLEVMAAGFNGPASTALASVGVAALASARDPQEARAMGRVFLEEIAKSTASEPESRLAAAARAGAARKMTHEMAAAFENGALKMLAAGLNGPAGQVLATFGRDILGAVSDPGCAREAGYEILSIIRDTSRNASESLVARAAFEASSEMLQHPSGRGAQARAFEFLADPTRALPPQAALARYGLDAVAAGVSDADAQTISQRIFTVLGDGATTPEEAGTIQACQSSANQCVTSWGAARFRTEVLRALAASAGQAPVDVLARLGQGIGKMGLGAGDQRAAGEGLLQGIAGLAPDRMMADLASRALRTSQKQPGQAGWLQNLRGIDPVETALTAQAEGFGALLARSDEMRRKQQQERMDEIQDVRKMAEALNEPPPPDARVQVDDDAIYVGGIRIDRKQSTPEPQASA